jgi:hypothetical protein
LAVVLELVNKVVRQVQAVQVAVKAGRQGQLVQALQGKAMLVVVHRPELAVVAVVGLVQ